jgi:hypothetical protein
MQQCRHPKGMGIPRQLAGIGSMSFQEVLTLRMVRGLRRAGMPMRAIRRVAALAAIAFNSRTPLVLQRFRTDGAALFVAVDEADRIDEDLIAPDDDDAPDPAMDEGWRRAFADMVDQVLFRDLDWEKGAPVRWWPLGHTGAVVVDPRVLGGAPHVAGTMVTTAAAARDAGGLTPEQARDAVRFENVWMTAAIARAGVKSDSSPRTAVPAPRLVRRGRPRRAARHGTARSL